MCGRFVSVSSPALIAERFRIDEVALEEHDADYNVTPRATIYAIRERAGQRQLALLRWGLVPPWAKDPSIGDRLINARAESLADKPAFRKAFAQHRCLIPADGFYEWKKLAKGKQPMFIHRRDGEPLAFAGLWAAWRDPADSEGEWLRSCTIITTDANALLEPVHDRMPVVLPESAWDTWLDPECHDLDVVRGLLVAPPSEELEMYPVSTLVNSPGHNGPELVERVDPETLLS